MSKEDIDEILTKLQKRREDQIQELKLSANPDDWIKANGVENVTLGIVQARQALLTHGRTPGNKITGKDVYNWAMRMGEDPIMDGPILLNRKEQHEFMQQIDPTLIDFDIFADLSFSRGDLTQKQREYILGMFAKFLNEKHYENKFKEEDSHE